MQPQKTTERVLVRVVGFSDVERHALNSMFRLSEDHAVSYGLWTTESPAPARLALLDGESYEAPMAAMSWLEDLKLIWVGAVAPKQAWRRFDRPIAWPEVLRAMDELFAPAPELDFDLDLGADTGPDTQPPETQERRKRALIASGSRDERLYLRARLALADLTQADEAETVPQALELIRTHHYDVTLVDFALPGNGHGWTLLRQLVQARESIGRLIMTKDSPTWPERVRARFGGAQALFGKPLPSEKLHDLLQKL